MFAMSPFQYEVLEPPQPIVGMKEAPEVGVEEDDAAAPFT